MIPYEVDPSLHNDKPVEPVLDDGFSPPETRPAPASQDGVAPSPAGADFPGQESRF